MFPPLWGIHLSGSQGPALIRADRAAYQRCREILDPLGIAIEVADAVKRLKGRRVPFSRLLIDGFFVLTGTYRFAG
jgi:hypothetical protein